MLRNEWLNFGSDFDDVDSLAGSVNDATEQIDGIESTYIKCHCYIAEELSSQVYTKNKTNCKLIITFCHKLLPILFFLFIFSGKFVSGI